MSLFPEAATRLILDDHRGDGSLIRPNAKGLYHADGNEFPLASVGQSAVILLECEDGCHELLMSRRALHLNFGGRWALFGGHLEFGEGEGLLQGIWREVLEESNGTVDLHGMIPTVSLPPAIEYKDKTIISLHHLFILKGEKANQTRQAFRHAIVSKTFDKDNEVIDMDIVRLDENLDTNLAEKGGLCFWQEERELAIVRASLPHWVPRSRPRLKLRPPYAEPVITG